jgi:hypothetical protein
MPLPVAVWLGPPHTRAMTTTRKKRPRDPVQLGKLIVQIATGQVEDREDDGKSAAAVELGRKGGAARAARLTPEERSEIARRGAARRWKDS